MEKINTENLTAEQRKQLLFDLQADEKNEKEKERKAYEGLREQFIGSMRLRVMAERSSVFAFNKWLIGEIEAFRAIMEQYGAVSTKQMSFVIRHDNFKVDVRVNKVKRFDERADLAAIKLVKFLKNWIKSSKKGTEDPVYQLAMMAIERNQRGDLDYKQVSNLYKLEGKFNSSEYTDIMELFRESHIVEGTAMHFYFYECNELGVWRKLELSFNRL